MDAIDDAFRADFGTPRNKTLRTTLAWLSCVVAPVLNESRKIDAARHLPSAEPVEVQFLHVVGIAPPAPEY